VYSAHAQSAAYRYSIIDTVLVGDAEGSAGDIKKLSELHCL
jgi:hypothetical protein